MMPDAFIAASICVLAIFWSCWKFCDDFTFSRPSSSFLGVGWSKSNCYIYGRVYLFGY